MWTGTDPGYRDGLNHKFRGHGSGETDASWSVSPRGGLRNWTKGLQRSSCTVQVGISEQCFGPPPPTAEAQSLKQNQSGNS